MAREQVSGCLLPDSVEVRVPCETASRERTFFISPGNRCSCPFCHCLNRNGIQQLFTLPVTFPEHQPSDACRRPWGEISAAPVGDNIQSADIVSLPIANTPFIIFDPDRLEYSLCQQGPYILYTCSPVA